ncbi:MAG: ArsC/Spx/MgsR family protein [Bacteroidota bacterium]
MKKIWHLSTCDTCQGIICELGGLPGFEKQDIKQQNITPEQLDFLKEKVGSYEALFSRQARKYRELGLKNQALTEADYRRLILEEYTFLKRPVIVDDETIFVGNLPKTVAAAKAKIQF